MRRNHWIRLVSSGFALLSLSAAPVGAQHGPSASQAGGAEASRRLGTVHFPNSGASAAQAPFLQGVALLHSFEYTAAREAFRAAQQADPGFALAYWGEALTHQHLLWGGDELADARRALEKLGKTSAHRVARAPTPREKDFLRAADSLLYPDAERALRLVAYARAMERMLAAYPGDPEVAMFGALALMTGRIWVSTPEQRTAWRDRAEALVEQVFAANPNHPGAAHYMIHLFDYSPDRARRALTAALRYAEIAPDAPHAHHMPSHVFNSLGMWERNVASNVAAYRATQRTRTGSELANPSDALHSLHYMQYALLQLGRWREARSIVDSLTHWFPGLDLRGQPQDVRLAVLGQVALDAMETGERFLLARHPTLFEADPSERDAPYYLHYAAVLAAQRGDTAALRTALQRVSAVPNPRVLSPRARIVQSMLGKQREALAARHLSGDPERAITLLDEAAKIEEGTTSSAPPYFPVSHDLLAAALLEAGRVPEAAAAFERALRHRPNRAGALLGLARARATMGDREGAAAVYRQLLDLWKHADPDLPALEEVRRGARHSG